MARFDKGGRYQPDSQPLGKTADGVTLSLDRRLVKGLDSYEPGDTVELTIKCRLGTGTDDVANEVDVLSVHVEPMDSAASMHRRDQKRMSRVPSGADDMDELE